MTTMARLQRYANRATPDPWQLVRRLKRLEAELERLQARIDELEKRTSPHALAGYD